VCIPFSSQLLNKWFYVESNFVDLPQDICVCSKEVIYAEKEGFLMRTEVITNAPLAIAID